MSAPSAEPRPDSALADFDIPAAVRAGLRGSMTSRQVLFADGAVAAALRADALHVDPAGMEFLAGYVRSAGRAAAATLPEPLVGGEATELARTWLQAAAEGVAGPATPESLAVDDLLAQWLLATAAVLRVRRNNRPPQLPAAQRNGRPRR